MKNNLMNKLYKATLCAILLICAVHMAIADSSIEKNKSKIVLNIHTPLSIRDSISYNIKTGLNYNGSSLICQQIIGNSIINSSIITYQKGNTIYIISYKFTTLDMQ